MSSATGSCVILRRMTNTLDAAVEALEQLPEADQENIGRQVLQHVEKLRLLRGAIDQGLHSLDAGGGIELDIDEVISRARAGHDRR